MGSMRELAKNLSDYLDKVISGAPKTPLNIDLYDKSNITHHALGCDLGSILTNLKMLNDITKNDKPYLVTPRPISLRDVNTIDESISLRQVIISQNGKRPTRDMPYLYMCGFGASFFAFDGNKIRLIVLDRTSSGACIVSVYPPVRFSDLVSAKKVTTNAQTQNNHVEYTFKKQWRLYDAGSMRVSTCLLSNSVPTSEYLQRQMLRDNMRAPKANPDFEAIPASDDLNSTQAAVLNRYLSMQEGVGSVEGPFGTGKSATLARLACWIVSKTGNALPQSRVMISAHSNRAISRNGEGFVDLLNLINNPSGSGGRSLSDRESAVYLQTMDDIRKVVVHGKTHRLRVFRTDPLAPFCMEFRVQAARTVAALALFGWSVLRALVAENWKSLHKSFNLWHDAVDALKFVSNSSQVKNMFVLCAMEKQISAPLLKLVKHTTEQALSTAQQFGFLSKDGQYRPLPPHPIEACRLSSALKVDPTMKDAVKMLHQLKDVGVFSCEDQVVQSRLTEVYNGQLSGCRNNLMREKNLRQVNFFFSLPVPASELQKDGTIPSLPPLKYSNNFIKEINEDAFMSRASIFLATSTCHKALSHSKFTQVTDLLFDEAGQSSEPSTRIPFLKKDLRKALLIGDECQLPPFAPDVTDIIPKHFDQAALSEHLKSTLFGRLAQEQRAWPPAFSSSDSQKQKSGLPALMLATQYRVFPRLASFLSEAIYDKRLLNGPNVQNPLRTTLHLGKSFAQHWEGLSFLHPQTDLEKQFRAAGLSNLLQAPFSSSVRRSQVSLVEACAAVMLLRHFLNIVQDNKKPLSIAILSPYLAQTNLIEGLCSETVVEFDNPRDNLSLKSRRNRDLTKHFFYRGREVFLDVRTVDGYQGGEADIVILSLAKVGGFTEEKRRMNVALSRGRMGLIILNSDRNFSKMKEEKHSLIGLLYRHCNSILDKSATDLLTDLRDGVSDKTLSSKFLPTWNAVEHHVQFA
eukprot:GDKJ01031504.1.p1 GENE.GDKJ01031504.1~~GDKJ01031504.1.p1  ORF type:complete len:970 (+),score=219.35 GDKJ01031504.1:1-2910(+)